MNTEYTCIDEKVVVRDEKGCNKVIFYQDNIEEVLISENTIEELEKMKEEINKDINNYIKRCNMPILLKTLYNITPLVIGVIAPLLITPAFDFWGVSKNMLAVVKNISIITMCFTAVPSFLLTMSNILQDKYKDRELRALNTQMEMLDNDLNDELKHLEKLRNDNTKSMTRDYKTNVIDNSNIKEKINSFCEVYYDCGYNLEDYYDYYLEHSKLPKSMQRKYNEQNQEKIKEYIEQKGPVLVKTRPFQKK